MSLVWTEAVLLGSALIPGTGRDLGPSLRARAPVRLPRLPPWDRPLGPRPGQRGVSAANPLPSARSGPGTLPGDRAGEPRGDAVPT